MTTNRRVFWIGLLIYAASFFLVALGPADHFGGDQPLFGFVSAYISLIAPLVAKGRLLGRGVVFYICFLLTGWINVIFLAAVFLKLLKLRRRFASALGIIVIAMIPSSWILAFYYFRGYPREGHILWITGMLLVLFSDKLGEIHSSS